MPTAQEVYASSVRSLPRSEPLRLATFILQDLSESGASALDYSDSWSDQDVRDLAAFSLQHAESRYGNGGDEL